MTNVEGFPQHLAYSKGSISVSYYCIITRASKGSSVRGELCPLSRYTPKACKKGIVSCRLWVSLNERV